MTAKIRQPRYRQIFEFNDEMAEAACTKWAEVVDHLTSNGLVTQTRLRIADRYVRAHTEYDKLYPEAAEEGPVKKGPNGGDVFNFKWSAVEKLNDRIGKFEEALLISPKSAQDKLTPVKPKSAPVAADEFLKGK